MRLLVSKLFLVATVCAAPVVARAYYDWVGSGCFEISQHGSVLRQVDRSLCQSRSATYFRMIGSSCWELSPYGDLIQQVDRSRCFARSSY